MTSLAWRSILSLSIAACAPSCAMNSFPITPVQPMTATETTLLDRVKALCTDRRARVTSCLSTTAETCLSDEPCAMARMLTPAVEMAFMKVAETPGVKAMPSPTMATTDMPLSSDTELMVERSSSSSKADCRALSALSPWSSGTATQIECSEEAWVIMMMLTSAEAMAPKNLLAAPLRPMMEAPSRLRTAILSIEVMPLMGMGAPFLLTTMSFWSWFRSRSRSVRHLPWITDPSKAGLKMLRTYTGMLASMHGTMADG
mmetsp:Transcript_40626/g.99797  ORF Transcript_40626/g.99797 Transcript_40626/m.99797 type:complete len:258 (-) Transcript_40626:1213-1986(-)